MKQEEKELLLKDLCARLPYGVQGITLEGVISPLITKGEADWDILTSLNYRIVKHEWRPYLRPMSNMTEDEKTMFNSIWDSDWDKALTNQIAKAWDRNGFENQTKILEIAACANAINFLISNHFDYNGLIEKGLAIEAPKDMYKF